MWTLPKTSMAQRNSTKLSARQSIRIEYSEKKEYTKHKPETPDSINPQLLIKSNHNHSNRRINEPQWPTFHFNGSIASHRPKGNVFRNALDAKNQVTLQETAEHQHPSSKEDINSDHIQEDRTDTINPFKGKEDETISRL